MATHFVKILSRLGWVSVPEPARSLFPWYLVPGPKYQVPGTWFQAGLGPGIIRNDSRMIPELSPAERVMASSSDPRSPRRGPG